MFRNTMGKVYRKVYRKLSNKGYPMNVYILKSGVKGRKKFYKVLKYLFKRWEMSIGEEGISFINKCSLLFYSQQEFLCPILYLYKS